MLRLCYQNNLRKAILDLYPEIGYTGYPRGKHWNHYENRKKFFDLFAKEEGFDPLHAEKWYPISGGEIKAKEGGSALLAHFGNALSKALVDTYPTVPFDFPKFGVTVKGHYRDVENTRRFFDGAAKSIGFDPLVPENWYKMQFREITKFKGGYAALNAYGNSLSKAVMAAYPDIGLIEQKFGAARNFWRINENVKLFFDEFAKQRHFDPLIPENWYKVGSGEIRREPKGGSVLQRFGRSLAKALFVAYPSTVFEEHKFKPMRIWVDVPRNRKLFFEAFAKKMKFDPLVLSNWHSIPRKSIEHEKSGKPLLNYFGGSLKMALEDAFKFNVVL